MRNIPTRYGAGRPYLDRLEQDEHAAFRRPDPFDRHGRDGSLHHSQRQRRESDRAHGGIPRQASNHRTHCPGYRHDHRRYRNVRGPRTDDPRDQPPPARPHGRWRHGSPRSSAGRPRPSLRPQVGHDRIARGCPTGLTTPTPASPICRDIP